VCLHLGKTVKIKNKKKSLYKIWEKLYSNGEEVVMSYNKVSNLTVKDMQRLVTAGRLALDETAKGSPSTQEFLTFMTKWPQCVVSGYSIEDRPDSRMVINAIYCDISQINATLLREFSSAFGEAYDFACTQHQLWASWA
jgi:hypothetical protein